MTIPSGAAGLTEAMIAYWRAQLTHDISLSTYDPATEAAKHDINALCDLALAGLRAREPVLTAEAWVGNTSFAKGIKERLVIERAQREYIYQQEPEQVASRQRLRDEFGWLLETVPKELQSAPSAQQKAAHQDQWPEAAVLADEATRVTASSPNIASQSSRHPIVGWMVFDADDQEHAAMYNLSQKDRAFNAAGRWKSAISALCIHPDAPEQQKAAERRVAERRVCPAAIKGNWVAAHGKDRRIALADRRAGGQAVEVITESERERFACKVCGNTPDDQGYLLHGRGCYQIDEQGAGEEYIPEAVKPSAPSGLAERLPNPDEVICPACVHQFRAVPVNVQERINALEYQKGVLARELCDSGVAWATKIEEAHARGRAEGFAEAKRRAEDALWSSNDRDDEWNRLLDAIRALQPKAQP